MRRKRLIISRVILENSLCGLMVEGLGARPVLVDHPGVETASLPQD